MPQTLFITGRHPELSFAELAAVYPQAKLRQIGGSAVIAENLENETVDLRRLGGVVKSGQVFAKMPKLEPKPLVEKILDQLGDDRKINFGVSCYGRGGEKKVKSLLLSLKKNLRELGANGRFVNKNFRNLTSAETKLEGLVDGKGVELLVIDDGRELFCAFADAVQPFDEFKKRDYEKSARDARVGMLPPKLAQMMVNLAQPSAGDLVYDPFCGTGTVLLEAGLLDRSVAGSDLDEAMVTAARQNLASLKISGEAWQADAARKSAEFEKTIPKNFVVVSEGYLGPPRKTLPDFVSRQKTFRELTELYRGFFSWLSTTRVVICFPVYLEKGQPKYFSSDEILPAIAKSGWQPANAKKLVYSRADQIVGRQVVVLEKVV